jgi:hypothetical protein
MNPSASPVSAGRYARFADFCPYYLSEHSNRTCRRLHFVGTCLVLVSVATAWVGHLVFEKNRPATFSHPWYSLAGDFVLFRDMLIKRIPF